MDVISFQEIKKVSNKVGDVSELTTQNKNNLVSAINEVNERLISTNLYEYSIDVLGVDLNEVRAFYMPLTDKGYIKGVRATGNENTGIFSVKLLSKENGYYIYDSGLVENLLWDIMDDNPFVDETGENKIYVVIENKGVKTDFKLQIYVKKVV